MTSAIWFLAGFLVSDIIGRLASLTRAYLMFKQVELDCLTLIGTAAKDYAFMKEVKKQSLEAALSTSRANEIKIQDNIDEHAFQSWKSVVIKNMISNYPFKFRKNLRYYNWSTAMEYLTEQLKEKYNQDKK